MTAASARVRAAWSAVMALFEHYAYLVIFYTLIAPALLGLLAIAGGGQSHHPEHSRTDALGQPANQPTLAGGIAALEDDDDPPALLFYPVLELAQLGLQSLQFPLVRLAAQLLSTIVSLAHRPLLPPPMLNFVRARP